MCGRYQFTRNSSDDKLSAILTMMDDKYPNTYKIGEIFPGDTTSAVIQSNGRIVPVPTVSGFPGFRNGKLIINARTETVSNKPMFSENLRDRRVVLPADGFYEWTHMTGKKKEKYHFRVDSQVVIYLCGIYKVVEGIPRFVIITRPANESMIEIHNRMPVIVEADQVRPYLTDYSAAEEIITMVAPMLSRVLVN
jgi:putative SOS response-associated peptidase YedK